MIRAFLALDVPMAVRSALVVQQFLLPVKDRVAPEDFHITLVFLGEHPEPMLGELHLALDSRRLGPRLTLQIAGLGLFGKSDPHNLHAVVRPDPALEQLQARLSTISRQAGFALEARRFAPHVTLSRLKRGQFERAELEAAVARDALFRTDPFEVTEVTLYRSILRRDGPVYDALASYPLG
jgi:RNA 2',3'-cyclic 3'-phosphodiesterase